MNTDQNLGQGEETNVEVNVTNPFIETSPIPMPETAYPDVSSSSPMVAVSGGGGNVPSWFYLIFGFTLVAFFSVTGLLVFSFFSKKAVPLPITSPPTPTSVSSPITPTPVILYLDQLKRVSDSDILSDIEKDVNQTDFDQLGKEVSLLDSELDFTP